MCIAKLKRAQVLRLLIIVFVFSILSSKFYVATIYLDRCICQNVD